MRGSIASLRFVRSMAVALTLAAGTVGASGAAFASEVEGAAGVAELLAPGTTRFFASGEARENALPSYALVEEPNAKGPTPTATAGKDFAITPEFAKVDGKHALRVRIEPGTSLYGTGEAAGPLLRNGRRVVAWNTDAYGYDDSAISLYKSHPWVLAVKPDGTAFGVLADTTYRCTIDTGYSDPSLIQFIADGPEFPAIVIEKATPQEVVQELTRLTGRMPLPPKWALGYHQCRYSYFPEKRVREIAGEFRKREIPCDVIWYDIDYMEAFRVFTFDRGHFPDPKKLNDDLLKQGFHNVWMIDPGVKSRKERGPADRAQAELDAEPESARNARLAELAKFTSIVDAGTKGDVWVKRADGTVYEGEVWPGMCYFPDYTRPDVRQWWSGLYADFMANGITGVWNDMNEPAVFNVKSKTMPENNLHAGDPAMIAPSGKAQGERAKGDHARYHNVYGLNMVKGTREGIQRANPDKRPFVLSRALFIGGQRYGAGWSGDNSADWYHMENSIPMSLNMGLSGFAFYGPDVGGFAGNGDAKLYSRWFAFGAMLPFSRGHTGKGNIDKEPWSFGPEVEQTCRDALTMRYRLMPYLYTAFREASETGMPVARPLFFADARDPALRSEDDAFMLGNDIIVAAQMVPDRTRAVIVPKGFKEFKLVEREDPDLPRLFIREGAIVPLGPVMQFVDATPLEKLELLVCPDAGGKAAGTIYDDAGDGFAYRQGDFSLTRLEATREGAEMKVRESKKEGTRATPWKGTSVRIAR